MSIYPLYMRSYYRYESSVVVVPFRVQNIDYVYFSCLLALLTFTVKQIPKINIIVFRVSKSKMYNKYVFFNFGWTNVVLRTCMAIGESARDGIGWWTCFVLQIRFGGRKNKGEYSQDAVSMAYL